jgi:hypothetical protein
MHRNLFASLRLLPMLLPLAVGLPAHALPLQPQCTAGHPNAWVIQSTPTSNGANNGLIDNGDGTVTHGLTGLMWKQCTEGLSGYGCLTGPAVVMTWANALGAAITANTANGGLGFANHNDWRLPNKNELESIIESCGYNPSINQAVFLATPGSHFWSASSYVGNPRFAWYVSFLDGVTDLNVKAGLPVSFAYVRLVRGGQSVVDSFDLLKPYIDITPILMLLLLSD